METFNKGERVIFRESEWREPELGIVDEVLPPNETHLNGGLYILKLDDGSMVEAWWAELTRVPRNDSL